MEIELMQKIIDNQNVIMAQNHEMIFAQHFHDAIKGSKWLPKDAPLSPGRGTLGYPALYVLYRILNEFRPTDILECGMGQSTKMISMYNQHYKKAHHCVVEHDGEWIKFFQKHFKLAETTEVVELPVIDTEIEIGEDKVRSNVTVYSDFAQTFENRKFDFMCIDGPFGFRSPIYSRIDLLSLLPGCLKKSFVILLDDCDRQGELNTFDLMMTKLLEEGIEFKSSIYNGEKGTGIIVSKDLEYMCTI